MNFQSVSISSVCRLATYSLRQMIFWLLVSFSLFLSACSDGTYWFGRTPPPPIPGERIDIFRQFSPGNIPTSQTDIDLPTPVVNSSWFVEGGNSQHQLSHPAFDHQLRIAWQKKVGRAASERRPFHIQPVAHRDKIYVVDTRYRVIATELASGKILWHTRLSVPAHDLDAFGGGVALLPVAGKRHIFVCTGYGTLEVLRPENGRLLWKKQLPQACHAPPVGNDRQVFVSMIDNTLWAFDSQTGDFLWQFTGTPQLTRIGGSAAPAVSDSLIFYPLSSGEIIALDTARGQTLWGDFLIRKDLSGFVQNLDDLRASPVLNEQNLYALSSSGTAVALKQVSGKKLWKSGIASLQTPWISGNAIFILDGNRLIALNKHDGSLFWQVPLPKKDHKNQRLQHWLTPVLAESVLYLLNHNGSLLRINAKDGSFVSSFTLEGVFDASPVIVNKTILFLSREGVLSALK